MHSYNPHTIKALQLKVAVEVKSSQLPVLTVDPNVHTGAVLTGFYCHFDHPEQYQTMFLPVKNGTHFDLYMYLLHVRLDSVWIFKCTRYTLGSISKF